MLLRNSVPVTLRSFTGAFRTPATATKIGVRFTVLQSLFANRPLAVARCLLWALVSWLTVLAAHRTDWYRQRLANELISVPSPRREKAAQALANLGGEKWLILALRNPSPEVREAARNAIDTAWFASEGVEPARQLLVATTAINEEHFDEALARLDSLIQAHPHYAEALNRRASLHWQMGRPGASIRDCERALEANRLHYGAWQGLGLCHLYLGNTASARTCLQTYLRLQPYDPVAPQWLKWCDLLDRMEKESDTSKQTAIEAMLPKRPSL